MGCSEQASECVGECSLLLHDLLLRQNSSSQGAIYPKTRPQQHALTGLLSETQEVKVWVQLRTQAHRPPAASFPTDNWVWTTKISPQSHTTTIH